MNSQISVFSTLTASFPYVAGAQSFTVPPGVTSLTVSLTGASGGDMSTTVIGGRGATITTTLAVTPGETLQFFTGGQGVGLTGGYNGGGAAGAATSGSLGTGGGGATDIRRTPYTLNDRLAVAGGGGGSYSPNSASGGAGGYPSGVIGMAGNGVQGGGGTATAGGTAGTCSTSAGGYGVGGVGCGPYGGPGGGNFTIFQSYLHAFSHVSRVGYICDTTPCAGVHL